MTALRKIIALGFLFGQYSLFAQWSAPMSGLGYGGYGIFLNGNGKLYILNSYSTGTDTICGIAEFDGTNYSAPMPPGFPATTAAVYNNEFYVGGGCLSNTNCGFLPNGTCNIAKWNGSGWSSVGTGGPGGTMLINAMAVYKGELYVGGDFTSMGGVSVNRIARWNGTQWKTVGSGVTGSVTKIKTMTVYNGNLYVGGIFGNAGGVSAFNIARWNGTQWDSVGWGTDDVVNVLYTDTIDNVLYAGGAFNNAGGSYKPYFAKWNDTAWSSVGNYNFLDVFAITRYNNDIYVGTVDNQGSVWDSTLVKWNGNYWCPMVPGPNSSVRALAEYNGKLYIGGYFDTVGVIPAFNIATWGGAPCPTAGINEIKKELRCRIFPNPAKAEINIIIEENESTDYIVEIYNAVGSKIKEQKFMRQIKVQTTDFAKGVYQIHVRRMEENISHTERIILE